jgi:hypothetical protein
VKCWPCQGVKCRNERPHALGASAPRQRPSTVAGVARPGTIDARRQLLPADYIAPAGAFGIDRRAGVVVPPGGDEVSARTARIQHQLVVVWNGQTPRPSGAALAREFGFSRQTFSRCRLGQQWAGQTVLCAVIDALQQLAGAPGRMAAASSPPGRSDRDAARESTREEE